MVRMQTKSLWYRGHDVEGKKKPSKEEEEEEKPNLGLGQVQRDSGNNNKKRLKNKGEKMLMNIYILQTDPEGKEAQ